MQSFPSTPANHPDPYTLLPVERAAPGRQVLEHFVARRFAQKHCARVQSFMPVLLALHNRGGELAAVAGFRPANAGPLYLEQYLELPIEQALARATGASVSRDEIVEIGNLASTSCGMARRLVAQLPRYLLSRGSRWAVFTATRTVRELLGHLGGPVIELGRADPARVQASGEDWGAYYDTDPRVMAGFLPAGRHFGLRRGTAAA